MIAKWIKSRVWIFYGERMGIYNSMLVHWSSMMGSIRWPNASFARPQMKEEENKRLDKEKSGMWWLKRKKTVLKCVKKSNSQQLIMFHAQLLHKKFEKVKLFYIVQYSKIQQFDRMRSTFWKDEKKRVNSKTMDKQLIMFHAELLST